MSNLADLPPELQEQIHVQHPPSVLTHLQQQFCIAKLNGRHYLVDRQEVADALKGSGKAVHFHDKADGNLVLARFLQTQPGPLNGKELIKQWWENPHTHVYDEVAFDPQPTPPNALNFWVGPTAEAVPGNCTLITDFLRDVICDGHADLYDYLVKFLAHMLQKPQEKPGIFVVLLGGQGIGKGTFFQLLQRIWGCTTLLVSDVAYVIGQFNAQLERHYVVCMDEALFNGDKKSIERMKSMVTEPTVSIEEKHQPRRTIRSFHRFFAASNNDHFAHIDADDRRHLFFRVSNRHQKNQEYFTELFAALNDPQQVGAFVNHLQQVDLTGFDVRQRPITGEHAEQKLASLKGFERYWFDLLMRGHRPGYGYDFGSDPDRGALWRDANSVPSHTVMQDYKAFDKGADRYQTFSYRQLAKEVAKLCPRARDWRGSDPKVRERGYQFPSLTQARQDFETFLGCRVRWESDGADTGWEWQQRQAIAAMAEIERCLKFPRGLPEPTDQVGPDAAAKVVT